MRVLADSLNCFLFSNCISLGFWGGQTCGLPMPDQIRQPSSLCYHLLFSYGSRLGNKKSRRKPRNLRFGKSRCEELLRYFVVAVRCCEVQRSKAIAILAGNQIGVVFDQGLNLSPVRCSSRLHGSPWRMRNCSMTARALDIRREARKRGLPKAVTIVPSP